MRTLPPARVEASRALGWMSWAARALVRRPLPYGLAMAAYLGVIESLRHALSSTGWLLGHWAGGAGLVLLYFVGCAVAAVAMVLVTGTAAGESWRPAGRHLLSLLAFLGSSLLWAGGLYALATPLIYWLVDSPVSSGAGDAPWLVLLVHAALLMTLWALVDLRRLHFCLPLMLFQNVSWADARLLSAEAQQLNGRPLRRLRLPVYAALLLTLLLPPLVLLLFPWIGAIWYAAYLEVFAGESAVARRH